MKTILYKLILHCHDTSIYGKIKNDICEANYHMLFLSIFRLMGFFVVGEVPFLEELQILY
jgi:hypothetical protein